MVNSSLFSGGKPGARKWICTLFMYASATILNTIGSSVVCFTKGGYTIAALGIVDNIYNDDNLRQKQQQFREDVGFNESTINNYKMARNITGLSTRILGWVVGWYLGNKFCDYFEIDIPTASPLADKK